MTNRPYYATGSALLVCLVLLVVMTLLVVGGISISTTQEKMTGNTQNKQVSFQAAESLLRMAENAVTDNPLFTFPPTGNNGYHTRSKPGDTNFPIWESENNSDWNNDFTFPSSTISSTVADDPPQVIFERYSKTYRDRNCRLKGAPAGDECWVIVFRITAKGYGTNEHGVTLLQSTFKSGIVAPEDF